MLWVKEGIVLFRNWNNSESPLNGEAGLRVCLGPTLSCLLLGTEVGRGCGLRTEAGVGGGGGG